MTDYEKYMKQLLYFETAFNARKMFNDLPTDNICDVVSSKEFNKIIEIFTEYINKDTSNLENTIEPGTILYRARKIDFNDGSLYEKGFESKDRAIISGYDESNSKEPPLGISSAGRNNFPGASYLYCASDEATACMEIKPIISEAISLAEFKVLKPLKAIDLASEKRFSEPLYKNISIPAFFTQLMFRYCQPATKDNDYYLSQLITDIIRKRGYDGVMYKSFFTEKGVNYTIFNCSEDHIKFQNSRVLCTRGANISFVDFNNQTNLHSNPNGYLMEYDEEQTKDLNKQIIDTITFHKK